MTETRAAALLPLPGINRRGARFPDRCAVGAWQRRYSAVFGRHRHPIVGLAHHRRLAGDRVAQAGEDLVGKSALLEDLDALAEPHRAYLGTIAAKPVAQRLGLGAHRDDAMTAVPDGRCGEAEFLIEPRPERRPIEFRIRVKQGCL